MRQGPRVILSCQGCEFYEHEYFWVQGDAGYDFYCTRTGVRELTGTYLNVVPNDCPYRPEIVYPKTEGA